MNTHHSPVSSSSSQQLDVVHREEALAAVEASAVPAAVVLLKHLDAIPSPERSSGKEKGIILYIYIYICMIPERQLLLVFHFIIVKCLGKLLLSSIGGSGRNWR